MNTVTVQYTGDRPFFLAMVVGVGRLTFNRHKGFSKQLPRAVGENLLAQWGRFFQMTIDPEPPPRVKFAKNPKWVRAVAVRSRVKGSTQ
jgi:hypothetical protein